MAERGRLRPAKGIGRSCLPTLTGCPEGRIFAQMRQVSEHQISFFAYANSSADRRPLGRCSISPR